MKQMQHARAMGVLGGLGIAQTVILESKAPRQTKIELLTALSQESDLAERVAKNLESKTQ